MKKLLLILFAATQVSVAQPRKGQSVPDFTFTNLINAPVQTATLHQLRGKIVLVEFWATWCAPCLEAMPHIKQLQQQYPDRLQVIAVTNESPKRIRQYLLARPSNLWFASDSADVLAHLFPHHIIPHSVLLAADGRLIASTTPQAITSQVIDSLWQQQPIHLPEKIDNTLSVAEVIQTYFRVTGQEQNRFIMQAEMEGVPSVRTTHATDSTFKNRRLTALNMSLPTLYQLAYGDVPYGRLIDRTGGETAKAVYCLDLIVPTPADLLPALRRELTSRFDLRATTETQTKEVNVLTITDQARFDRIPRNTSGVRTYASRRGEIDQKALTMADFADYLENYALSKGLVLDETGNQEKLDIKFSFQPENPQSLLDILRDMGVGLTRQSRPVEMLILTNAY